MMKLAATVFAPFLLALPAIVSAADATQQGDVIRLSEPVEVTDTYEVFGAPLSMTAPAMGLKQLVADSEQYLDTEVQVTTRVAKVCQKKGCFFVAQEGDAVARVTFKDYEFFIPTDSGGKQVTLAGTFTRRQISESDARHYQKDVGDSGPVAKGPRFEYRIVATSVRIPKS